MHPDHKIAVLAATQYGTFTRHQAFDAGFTDKAIASRVSRGLWIRLRPGLYAFAGFPETFHQRAVGGVLITSASSAASHSTAAFLHKLISEEPELIDVSVLHGTHYRPRPGLVVHQAVVLDRRDVRAVAGIATTTPTRTVVDLAGTLGPIELERVNDDAILRRLTSISTLRACIERVGASRRGMGRLKRLLDDREFGVPESELERLFPRLIARFRLPQPTRQLRRPSRHSRLDFAYTQLRIFIELDGRRWHSSGHAFRTDPRKQNAVVLDGMLPLRFTWHDLTNDPEYVAATIRQAIAMRSAVRSTA